MMAGRQAGRLPAAAVTAVVVVVIVVVVVMVMATAAAIGAVAQVHPDDHQGLPAGQQVCGLLFKLAH
jgi:hypothetical protein